MRHNNYRDFDVRPRNPGELLEELELTEEDRYQQPSRKRTPTAKDKARCFKEGGNSNE